MKLQELLANIKPLRIEGSTDVDITGVNIDSRKIKGPVEASEARRCDRNERKDHHRHIII